MTLLSRWLLACAPDTDAVPPEVASPTEVVIGARAVDFAIEGHDGDPIRLSDREGQVIVLDLSGFL